LKCPHSTRSGHSSGSNAPFSSTKLIALGQARAAQTDRIRMKSTYASEGTDAVMRLNGSDVHLRVIRKTVRYPNVHYEFADRAGTQKGA
jgi:hypothetical protein